MKADVSHYPPWRLGTTSAGARHDVPHFPPRRNQGKDKGQKGKEQGKGKRPYSAEEKAAIQDIGLTGSSAKERKAMRNAHRMNRAPGKRSGTFGPSNMKPPPKICNRVSNCSWDSGGSRCECEKWPQWLSEHGMPTGRAVPAPNFEPNSSIDPTTMSIDSTKGTVCSYYRPSGTKGFYFYNGIVHGAWSVQFPSGSRRDVVAIN